MTTSDSGVNAWKKSLVASLIVAIATVMGNYAMWMGQHGVTSGEELVRNRINLIGRLGRSVLKAGYLYNFRVRMIVAKEKLVAVRMSANGGHELDAVEMSSLYRGLEDSSKFEYDKSLEFEAYYPEVAGDLLLASTLFGDKTRNEIQGIFTEFNQDSLLSRLTRMYMAEFDSGRFQDIDALPAIHQISRSLEIKLNATLSAMMEEI